MFLFSIASIILSILFYAHDPIVGLGIGTSAFLFLFGNIISLIIYNCIGFGALLFVAHLYYLRHPENCQKVIENINPRLSLICTLPFASPVIATFRCLLGKITAMLQNMGYYQYADAILTALYK